MMAILLAFGLIALAVVAFLSFIGAAVMMDGLDAANEIGLK